MLLNELFDSGVSFRTERPGTIHFNIKGKSYTVDLYPGNEPGETELSFGLDQGPGADLNTGITRTGDELQVFATVLQIVRDHVAKSNPRMISFGAELKEPTRVKLYDRMAKTLGRDWPLETAIEGKLKVYKLTNPNYKDKQAPAPQDMQDVPF